MNTTNLYPERISNDIIFRARNLNSSLIADAMNGQNVMSHSIKPVNEEMKFVGTAVTVTMKPGDNLYLHRAIYDGRKGYVLVADGKSYTKAAYLGELMASAAEAIGLEGIVIDGLVRDRRELGKIGFPVFSKGFVSAGPTKDGPGDYNQVISCGGTVVTPGDLIVGDEDGVVVVPRESMEEILRKAEKKQSYEVERIELISQYKKEKALDDISINLEPEWIRDKF